MRTTQTLALILAAAGIYQCHQQPTPPVDVPTGPADSAIVDAARPVTDAAADASFVDVIRTPLVDAKGLELGQ